MGVPLARCFFKALGSVRVAADGRVLLASVEDAIWCDGRLKPKVDLAIICGVLSEE